MTSNTSRTDVELKHLSRKGPDGFSESADIEEGGKAQEEVKHLIFDAIGVQFHFGAFVYQFIAHIIFPLFAFMVNLSGQVNNNTYTWTSPTLVFVMIITYYVADGESTKGLQGAALISLVYYIQHRLVIAMKYGSLSPTEYKKFMKCRDPERSQQYRQQMELGSGWLKYNPDVVHFELAAASARIGARINDISIFIANPDTAQCNLNQLRAWNAFLRGHDVIDYTSVPCQQLRRMPDGHYRLSVYDLCEGLVLKAMKYGDRPSVHVLQLVNIFNWINLLIPLIIFCFHFDPSVGPFRMVVITMFLISATVINYVYAWTFYVLLFIAIVDVYRQLSVMSDLNCMIRLTDLMLLTELSSLNKDISDIEQDRVDQRVAEIMSIKGSCSKIKEQVQYEDPDRDAEIIVSALHENVLNQNQQGNSNESNMKSGSEKEKNSEGLSRCNRSSNSDTAPGYCVLGERIYRDNEAHWLPRISFDESHNILAWTHARLVMQNFGARFHFRLELYVIAAMAMLVIMMFVGLLRLGLSSNRIETFFTPWFLQALLSVTMCIVFLVTIIQTGVLVNDKMDLHSQTLSAHALRLNRKIEHLRLTLSTLVCAISREQMQNKIDKFVDTVEHLSAMREIVESNTQQMPFKIFGFTAQSSLTMSILTTAFTFYLILISLLSHRDGQAISLVGGNTPS